MNVTTRSSEHVHGFVYIKSTKTLKIPYNLSFGIKNKHHSSFEAFFEFNSFENFMVINIYSFFWWSFSDKAPKYNLHTFTKLPRHNTNCYIYITSEM